MGTTFSEFLRHMNPWMLTLILAWSVAWKGWALWRAARLKHAGWYIVLLIVNSVGIAEIIYIAATNRRYAELNSRFR
ncbi:MAG TPA: DUF5652 family protein [Syntrophomonadaceae bacterium]|nr:DUF5652 family protein [Syntrophomonadaceae bacterium]